MKRSSMCLWFLLAACFSVFGADKAATPPAPVTSSEMEKLKLYTDNDAGYSMRIPDGYTKLTEDETREVFHGISENFGKEAGQRVLRRPPAFFKGPPDLKDTKLKPPSLAIGYSDLDEPIDPAQMSYYKEKLEEQLRKTGDKFGEINISMVMVDGITSLRIEHDVLNPMDNSRARLIKIAVPGSGRRYDIVFNFSPEQTASVESAVATVLHTFKVNSHAAIDPETKSKWTRILYWTIGGFALGILLSVLLKVLSGVGETEPESSPK